MCSWTLEARSLALVRARYKRDRRHPMRPCHDLMLGMRGEGRTTCGHVALPLIPVIFNFGVTSRPKNGCRRGGAVSGASETSNNENTIGFSSRALQISPSMAICEANMTCF